MRGEPSVLHVDMDAFYAAVEQRDKPSLRGRPVVVGGVGPRGVVATASYEARRHGIRSAMATAEARRRCPRAAVLAPRFAVYARASAVVMGLLRELSPLVEPISLDEAFVDLAAGPAAGPLGVREVERVGAELKGRIHAATQLTASVGAGTSKLIAKIASDSRKPDGLVVVPPGAELELLDPLPVRAIWGVGPATAEALRRTGVGTVAQLRAMTETELVGLLGRAHGSALHALARARDDREVTAERELKSVSVEDTFEYDLVDVVRLRHELDRLADLVVRRLRRSGRSGRTVTVKVRRADFSTLSRSDTLRAPTDDPVVILGMARRLLGHVDTTGGVRLLGVGVSALAEFAQDDLFSHLEADTPEDEGGGAAGTPTPHPRPGGRPGRGTAWPPGLDVVHAEHGPGWVQGSGLGRVTVRFETAATGPGPVRTFFVDDPALTPAPPPPADGAAPTVTERDS